MKGFSALILIFLVGCAVGPNYQTPEVTLSSSYNQSHEEEEVDDGELKR